MNSPVLQMLTSLRRSRYLLPVVIIFFIVLYYNYAIVPLSISEYSGTKAVTAKQPTLSNRYPDKIYENVLHSQRGDVFRLGVVIKVNKTQIVEVSAHSIYGERVVVGEIVAEPSEEGEYKELVFSVPGRYENIALRSVGSFRENGVWGDSDIYVKTFFVSRIEVRSPEEMKSLSPTIFGISQTQKKYFSIPKGETNLPSVLKMVFLAESDAIRSIELTDELVNANVKGYSLSLFNYDSENKNMNGEVRSMSIATNALAQYRKPDGGYEVPFPSFLKKGQWYILTLTENRNNEFAVTGIFSLRKNLERSVSGKQSIAVHFISYMKHTNGTRVLDHARLEDLGKSFVYQFSLQGDISDIENLSDASKSIRFDQKNNMVGGSKKQGEYFVYKFDTVHPFEVFSFKATQSGNAVHALEIEYSFDDVSWFVVPFTQEATGPQKFSLSIPGDLRSQVVSLRVKYVGQTKKTGLFGLKELSVNAVVPKIVR